MAGRNNTPIKWVDGNRLNMAKRRIQAALGYRHSQPLEDKIVGGLLSEKMGIPILPDEIRRYILECGEDSATLASWGPLIEFKRGRMRGSDFGAPGTVKVPSKQRRNNESRSSARKKRFGDSPRFNHNPNLSKLFYESEAWRSVRYEALKKCGRRCLVCGRGPSDGIVLHVDHIKPRSRFPDLALDPDNLQVLCADCNLGKSNRDSIDWR